jgi:putative Holliday junction resolvase
MRPGVRVAVDVGSVRIGVAASDRDGRMAVPVETVSRGAGDLGRLREVITERAAVEVIVGLPLRLDGTPGPAAAEAERFARALARTLDGVPVRLFDERLTTAAAQAGLHGAGRTVKSSRKMIDEQAAVQILDDALRQEAATGQPVGVPVDDEGGGSA